METAAAPAPAPVAEPPKVELLTRNWRYALDPTPTQLALLTTTMRASRRMWNVAVAKHKTALAAYRHGRRERVVEDLVRLYLGKSTVGVLAVKVKKLIAEKGLTTEEARRQIATAQAIRQIKYRRSLAVQAAAEAAIATRVRHWPHRVSTRVAYGTVAFYLTAGGNWASNKGGEPRFRRAQDSAPLRFQLNSSERAPGAYQIGETVNLAPLGGQALAQVPVIYHRPLPREAQVKQVSVSRNSIGRWFLTLACNIPQPVVERQFAPTGLTCGVNPGIELALTIVPSHSTTFGQEDFKIAGPKGSRIKREDRRAARIARKLDRQVRANNPECFDEKGRWKKGVRAKVKSKAMIAERQTLNLISLHAANVRLDMYHKTAVNLLRTYDTIRIGLWRPAVTREKKPRTPSAPGVGMRRRATNRKTYRQAISTLVSALEDKAKLNRADAPKTIESIDEPGTTMNCPRCGAPEGPRGKEQLNRRVWVCPQCELSVLRDAGAAYNISRVVQAAEATTAQPASVKADANSGSASTKGSG